MSVIVLTVVNQGNQIIDCQLQGLPDWLEEHGELGKVHLLGILEQLANQIKHGPFLLPMPSKIQ